MRLLQSIRFRIAGMVIIPVLGLLALFVWNTNHLLKRMAIESARDSIAKYSQTLNLALSPYTDSEESLAQFLPFLQELVGTELGGITYLALIDESGRRIAATENVPAALPTPDVDITDLAGREMLHVSRPMLIGLSGVGQLRYGLSVRSIQDSASRLFYQNLRNNLPTLATLLLLIGGITGYFVYRINRRLTDLIGSSRRITHGNYDLVIEESGHDEITVLARQMNIMSRAIRERIGELERSEREIRELHDDLKLRSEELSATLDNLETTQESLIQAEKLAGLGSVVAAVAHELNTPVGNALTVATRFHEKTDRFHQSVQEGLRKSVLNAYLEDSRAAADMIHRNLDKAAELIASFKHVAVDQTSSQRRRFQLDDVIDDVLVTLRPGIRRENIVVDFQPGAAVEMDSFPGPLGQVITNLFNNAQAHAFDGQQEGRITIATKAVDDDQVEIHFADNGSGMTEEQLGKLFDPFYTTKLGKGGSGLGMHIVYNIVKSALCGYIFVESKPGEGTRYLLRLPRVVPAQENPEVPDPGGDKETG